MYCILQFFLQMRSAVDQLKLFAFARHKYIDFTFLACSKYLINRPCFFLSVERWTSYCCPISIVNLTNAMELSVNDLIMSHVVLQNNTRVMLASPPTEGLSSMAVSLHVTIQLCVICESTSMHMFNPVFNTIYKIRNVVILKHIAQQNKCSFSSICCLCNLNLVSECKGHSASAWFLCVCCLTDIDICVFAA